MNFFNFDYAIHGPWYWPSHDGFPNSLKCGALM